MNFKIVKKEGPGKGRGSLDPPRKPG